MHIQRMVAEGAKKAWVMKSPVKVGDLLIIGSKHPGVIGGYETWNGLWATEFHSRRSIYASFPMAVVSLLDNETLFISANNKLIVIGNYSLLNEVIDTELCKVI